jgi:integrase
VWAGERGEGTIFYRLDGGGNRISSNLYISYRAAGAERVVSAKTNGLPDAKRELKRLLRNRENAKEGKEPLITPKAERITIAELLDANMKDVREKRRATARQLGWRSEIIKKLLGHIRAADFRPAHVDEYKRLRRLGEGSRPKVRVFEIDGRKVRRVVKVPVGDVTIRRELECLTRAFTYAVERGDLRAKPIIVKPSNSEPREVEPPLEAVETALRAMTNADARDFVEWFLLTAMRPIGIGRLAWHWLDTSKRDAWTLSVPSEKRGNAREYAIDGSLRTIIERRRFAKREGCPFIFHSAGRRRDARWARRHWYRALKAAGLPNYWLYDVKRTAIGSLFDAGLSEAEVQHFSGHKTSPMVQRYHVKNADRHRESIRKRDEYFAQRRLADNRGDFR